MLEEAKARYALPRFQQLPSFTIVVSGFLWLLALLLG